MPHSDDLCLSFQHFSSTLILSLQQPAIVYFSRHAASHLWPLIFHLNSWLEDYYPETVCYLTQEDVLKHIIFSHQSFDLLYFDATKCA